MWAEEHLTSIRIDLPQSDPLEREGASNPAWLSRPSVAPTRVQAHTLVRVWILPPFDHGLTLAPDAIPRGGCLQAQRLVWTDLIVALPPCFKPPLLDREVRAGRPCGFVFQDFVHLLMGSVVTRASGPAKRDMDTELDPVQRQLRPPTRTGAAERRSVVAPNFPRHTIPSKQPTHDTANRAFIWRHMGYVQDVAAGEIAHRQGINLRPIPQDKPTLKIDRPHVVRTSPQQSLQHPPHRSRCAPHALFLDHATL